MDVLGTVALIVFAAAVGEAVNEFLFTPVLDWLLRKWPETPREQAVRLWSALVGVGIAFELDLDMFRLLGGVVRHPLVGVILTGILLGRGSNWVHEFIKRLVLDNIQRQANATEAVARVHNIRFD